MSLSKNLHWFICLIFFLSCAQQTSPTGGPKDTIPPILIHSIPPNEATHFKDRKIELAFSEMILVNNPKEQLIITPAIGKDFEVKVRKNSLIIELENELDTNTTYTINFRDAVQDITEKNSAKNLQLALSTGPYVDSLAISGTIKDFIKNKELKDITVAIHENNDTFNVLKHQASYFTKTNDKGNFKIDHLKPGAYYMYAFDDKNRNLIIDSKNESYGFMASAINLTKDTAKLSIGILRLDARALKITSTRPYNTYYNIRTSKNLKNFTINTADSAEISFAYGEDQSNIRIYNNLKGADSTAIQLTALDSIGNTLDTTLYAKFQSREIIPEKFTASLTTSSIIGSKGLLRADITLSKPIKKINFDSIFFMVDSVTKINITRQDIHYNKAQKKLTLNKRINKEFFEIPEDETITQAKKDTSRSAPKKLNLLYIGTASFISAENDSSKLIQKEIQPLKAADLSQIEYQLKTEEKNLIIELLDKDFNIIDQRFDQKKGVFQDIPAGEYQLRIIIDSNKNRTWDPGNILKKQEPEKMFYSIDESKSQIIKLKANWEIVLPTMLINS